MIFAIASPFQQIISYSNCTDLSFPGTRVVAGWLSCHRDSTLFISASFSIQTGPGSNIVIPVGALEPLLFAGASPGSETAGTHHSRMHARTRAGTPWELSRVRISQDMCVVCMCGSCPVCRDR